MPATKVGCTPSSRADGEAAALHYTKWFELTDNFSSLTINFAEDLAETP
jgi:hypothetical protein